MRIVIAAATLAALMVPALGQQSRAQAQPRPPAQAQPQTPAQAPAPPPIFPCRTEGEVCYLGVVTGNSQIAVLYTNAPQVEGIDAKPVDVTSGEAGSALDLAPHRGRVVMLTGTYDSKAGLTKAELVEVASPLVSLIVKSQVGDPVEVEEPPPAPPQRGGKAPPPAQPKR